MSRLCKAVPRRFTAVLCKVSVSTSPRRVRSHAALSLSVTLTNVKQIRERINRHRLCVEIIYWYNKL